MLHFEIGSVYFFLATPTSCPSSSRGELPGLGPLAINLNIDAKTNAIDVDNTLT